jgi:hypothetical protein
MYTLLPKILNMSLTVSIVIVFGFLSGIAAKANGEWMIGAIN